jgi:ABC-type Fe2+-enterobactin transport system substrate-binding protein
VSSTPKLLLTAVTVIGSLFSPNLYDHEETRALAHWRQDVWQIGQEELQQMVHGETLLFCLESDYLIKIVTGVLELQ